LSHWDVNHKDGFRHPVPAANLTMISYPLDNVPIGPPLVPTFDPDKELDPDELNFTRAWCCPSDNTPHGATTVTRIPKLKEQDEASVSSHDFGPSMPVLGPHHDDDSSLDEDSSED
jgi:hypothetical protein